MAAAAARAEQLDSIADNLANAQSPGFKATRPAFQSFLPGPGPTDKVFTAAVATGIDLRPGESQMTGNQLDIVPENGSFLSVQLANGDVAYTRNGALKFINNTLTSGGHPVLDGDGQPITIPPESSATVGVDGSVIVDRQPVAKVALYDLVGNVTHVGASLYATGPGGTASAVANARMRLGELELGNAPPLEAAIQMITAQRHFETAMQAVQTYRRMDDRAIELGKVR